MKKILILIPLLLMSVWSCVKEEPLEPSAKIKTNIVDNSLATKTKFILYLDETEGEFITFFKGDVPKRTYNKLDPTVTGTIVDENVDSVEVAGYGVAGEYTFVLMARSFGNWGEDEMEAIDSVRITVHE